MKKKFIVRDGKRTYICQYKNCKREATANKRCDIHQTATMVFGKKKSFVEELLAKFGL